VLRYFTEAYVDRVRSYPATFPYEKALHKRRVRVEPLFSEAKDFHRMRRFRLRRLETVNAEALLIAAVQSVKPTHLRVPMREKRSQSSGPLGADTTSVSRCLRCTKVLLRRGARSSVLQQPGKLRLLT
jgi:hypothetical protein